MSESENSPEVGLYPEWDEEEGGGPVKTFLEHLEDLRWTLIKCFSAVVISMVFCLVANPVLVRFLTWPLDQGDKARLAGSSDISIYMGDKYLGILPESIVTNSFSVGMNSAARVNLRLRPIGTNVVVVVELDSTEHKEQENRAVTLKNYGPIGAFMVAFKLMLYGGLVIASPLVIFFIGQFVLPALHIHEKRFLYQTAGFGAFLFFLGVAFCYFIVMQVALKAAVQFSQWMGFMADEWRAEDYISFVCKLMLVMGLSFQLPVVVLTMVKVGFLDYAKLIKFRPYWIVINLFICAVITPSGDPFTMVLIALPLQFLYELSAFISRFWEKRDKAAEMNLDKPNS
ncbi:MAG: Sec-independent protein translocase protein TatC [Verrucomicrobia subdivision 3 bacterium]|nr:Sec-independent protein translocase protein TatC [Limisphaerales bacterium]MCS1413844.1 Sec-independent protein translocase protein TatC [Limisphaerales bacterium]